jgi:hypothetical protein
MNSIIENSIFNNNIANQGGAIFNISNGGNHSNIIYQCTFFNNEASGKGNAIYNAAVTWPYFAFCQSVISNSIFKDKQNDAFEIFNYQDSDYQIAGVLLNTFAELYNCLYIYKLANIHFYVNTDEIRSYSTSLCKEIDPLFVNEANPIGPDNKWGTADDGLRLKPCSPAINAGNNSFVPVDITTDIAEKARIQLGTVDIGAYESNSNISPSIAMTNTSVTANQVGETLYYSDCDKLIAKVAANGLGPITGETSAKVYMDLQDQIYNYNPIVRRHYEITPINNASNASGNVTLYFTQKDFDIYNDLLRNSRGNRLPSSPTDFSPKDYMWIVKFPGISNNGSGIIDTYLDKPVYIKPNSNDIVWNETSNMWEISFNTAGFSGFFLQTIIILPLNLISFSGKVINQSTTLNWQTANELNTQSFDIERSLDGKKFEQIGSIASKNSSELQNYSFIDKNSALTNSDILYYRLKMIDLDGKFSYSKIVAVSLEKENSINISPNPTNGKALLNLEEKTKLLNTFASISNSTGQIVKQFKINKLTEEIDLGDLPKAVYLVKFQDGSTIKIIKD